LQPPNRYMRNVVAPRNIRSIRRLTGLVEVRYDDPKHDRTGHRDPFTLDHRQNQRGGMLARMEDRIGAAQLDTERRRDGLDCGKLARRGRSVWGLAFPMRKAIWVWQDYDAADDDVCRATNYQSRLPCGEKQLDSGHLERRTPWLGW
jgi:hypothetical protein